MTTLPSITARFPGQDTRLIEAAKRGETQAIRTLIAEGVDVNDADGQGVTALIVASCAGNLEAVRLLLNAGANTSAKDHMGYDAYHAAMFYGDFRGATMEPYDQIMALVQVRI